MLVGTIAFNVLGVIEPTDSSALAIWVLGYVFQGLGMAITFIVRLVSILLCSRPLTAIQFITVHFYRAIRYGFHRCVDHFPIRFRSNSSGDVEVQLRIPPSFPLDHPVTLATCHNFPRLTLPSGFTALALLKLGSYGRTM